MSKCKLGEQGSPCPYCEIEELKATLERVRALPEAWEQQDMEAQRPSDVPNGSQCADDLRKALQGEGDD